MDKAIYLSFLFIVLSPAVAQEPAICGTVKSVHDGDTITIIQVNHKPTRIRLGEIDAPELDQPYGSEAKQALFSMVANKPVCVTVQAIDQYGRTVGRVYEGDTDISAEMVAHGFAWVYPRYATDPALYKFQDVAEHGYLGLWGSGRELPDKTMGVAQIQPYFTKSLILNDITSKQANLTHL